MVTGQAGGTPFTVTVGDSDTADGWFTSAQLAPATAGLKDSKAGTYFAVGTQFKLMLADRKIIYTAAAGAPTTMPVLRTEVTYLAPPEDIYGRKT
ncbi:MAG: hypothetical protein LUO93_05985 [Methanomicrobiales archaeon]|nr:hypothetical protein [Methanomicrobiales archaeon]